MFGYSKQRLESHRDFCKLACSGILSAVYLASYMNKYKDLDHEEVLHIYRRRHRANRTRGVVRAGGG